MSLLLYNCCFIVAEIDAVLTTSVLENVASYTCPLVVMVTSIINKVWEHYCYRWNKIWFELCNKLLRQISIVCWSQPPDHTDNTWSYTDNTWSYTVPWLVMSEFMCWSNTSQMCRGGTNHWLPVVLPHIFCLFHSLISTASFSEIPAIVSGVVFSCEHLVEACWRNLAAPIVTSTVHFWASLQVMLMWYFPIVTSTA